jgi:hypothetical protein
VEDFRHAVRKDYASSWYPGVERFEDAVPVKVLPGTGIEGLEIKIEKRILTALRGRVAADDSTEGEVQVSLVRVATQVHAIQIAVTAQGTVKIGAEFEIDNVPPGTYSLRAEALGREKADGRWASMPLQVGEENQDGLDLVLRKAVRVTGRVRIEGREDNSGEPALSTDDVRVSLSPTVGFGSAPFPAPAQVAVKDGAFAFEGVIPDQYKLLAKVPAGYAVSEVRYNGEVCPYVVSIETGAEEQKLEIKLAPANGSVVAVVSEGTQPAAGATVVLMPEPVTDEGLRFGWTLLPAETGKDGRVTISGLLPGAYRLTAYPANGTWLDDPGLKQRLEAGEVARVTGAQPVTVQVRVQ